MRVRGGGDIEAWRDKPGLLGLRVGVGAGGLVDTFYQRSYLLGR